MRKVVKEILNSAVKTSSLVGQKADLSTTSRLATLSIDSLHQSAFSFIKEISESQTKFNFTSAGPLYPRLTKVKVPEHLLRLTRSLDLDDMEERRLSRGHPETLSALAEFAKRQGVSCSEKNISFTDDVLSTIAMTYDKANNKTLILTPVFGHYFEMLKNRLGIQIVTLATTRENNFLPDPKAIDKALTQDPQITKMLICNPSNPLGKTISKELAKEIAVVARKHGVYIIVDQALMVPNDRNDLLPFAAVDIENSFTICSLGKSVPSPRHGFVFSDEHRVKSLARPGGFPSQTQSIVVAMVEENEANREYFNQCDIFYRKNITLVNKKISELNEKFSSIFQEESNGYVRPLIKDPDIGNLYVLDFSGLRGKKYESEIMNSGLDVSRWLFKEAEIATVPGECFGHFKTSNQEDPDMFVRFVMNTSPNIIEEAFEKIIAAADKIKNPTLTPLVKIALTLSDGAAKGQSKC